MLASHFACTDTVIQNWQTPEVNVESYDLEYTCAEIEKLKSANRWKFQNMSINHDAPFFQNWVVDCEMAKSCSEI
jgi:hypothetical protein